MKPQPILRTAVVVAFTLILFGAGCDSAPRTAATNASARSRMAGHVSISATTSQNTAHLGFEN